MDQIELHYSFLPLSVLYVSAVKPFPSLQHKILKRVHACTPARRHHGRRAVLGNNRGAAQPVPRPELFPRVDRRFVAPCPRNEPAPRVSDTAPRIRRSPSLRRGQSIGGVIANHAHANVHHFHRALRVGIAISQLVFVVKRRARNRRPPEPSTRTPGPRSACQETFDANPRAPKTLRARISRAPLAFDARKCRAKRPPRRIALTRPRNTRSAKNPSPRPRAEFPAQKERLEILESERAESKGSPQECTREVRPLRRTPPACNRADRGLARSR